MFDEDYDTVKEAFIEWIKKNVENRTDVLNAWANFIKEHNEFAEESCPISDETYFTIKLEEDRL